MMKARSIAIAFVERDGMLLFMEGHDAAKGEAFYRPIGGGIEDGETGELAVAREFKEELGLELKGIVHLGRMDNHFTYNGKAGREDVWVYAGTIEGSAFESLDAVEDGRKIYTARWVSRQAVLEHKVKVFPEGILKFLN